MNVIRSICTWRRINATAALLSCLLWGVATYTGWINQINFVSHISMFTMIGTFIAGWRADVPDKKGSEKIDN